MCKSADVVDLPVASYEDKPEDHFLSVYCPNCDSEVDAACPDCGRHVESGGDPRLAIATLLVSDHFRRFKLYLRQSHNKTLAFECYLMATGDRLADGLTMKDLARKLSVRTATVSKQCLKACRDIGIEPSAYMRDELTRAKFKLSNWRPTRL